MIRPKTRVAEICQDIIPIAKFIKEEKDKLDNLTNNPLFKNDSTNQTDPIRLPKE
jgi:hypothetical protein